jgi:hypothetical protein
MQSEQQTLTFKVKFGEELRRFSVPLTSEWEEIISKICTIFNMERGTFTVKYEDDEKELITLDSTVELQEAVRINSSASLLCIRLEIFKSLLPVAQSLSVRSISEKEIPRGSFGAHPHHGHHGRKQWPQKQGRECNHATPCDILGEELAEKLKTLEEKGFKCKMKNIRLLKMNDGDVDKVSEILLQRKNKSSFGDKIKTLQENGYENNGVNVRLLRRYDGDVNKVMDILAKSKKLEESGYAHTWMNVRLLIKFDGDVEKVEKVWHCKQEKLLQRAEKKRSKMMEKDNYKSRKAEKHAWKKSCKKGYNCEH